jgi:hypothetical protein
VTWEQRIVAHLRRSKAEGITFDVAWDRATRLHPPRGRYCGPIEQAEQQTLFPDGKQEQDGPLETHEQFLRRVSSDAWHGRRPKLKNFTLDILREGEGGSSAVKAGHIRQAA